MEIFLSLATLTFLEIVLGIDNIIFVSIITNRLPQHQQKKGRFLGLTMALVFRIILLSLVAYLAHLAKPLFSVYSFDVSIRDIIMFAGGLFLIAKSTTEIHGKITGEEENQSNGKKMLTFSQVIFQIALIDLVFSFDSILTAVGLANEIWIMVTAVIISMIIMILFSEYVAKFIEKYPTVKMLALSFLLMIGTLLVLEAFHIHVPRGYIYFSLTFSLFVEYLNLKIRSRT